MLVMFYHHKFIFLPTLFIIIGILALLTNLGIVSVTIWEWWPIIFVIIGLYMFILQKRKKRILKGLMWYGAVNRVMKSDKVAKLLENKKVQDELKKIGDIAEGILTEQINKLHKKYTSSSKKRKKK